MWELSSDFKYSANIYWNIDAKKNYNVIVYGKAEKKSKQLSLLCITENLCVQN